MRAMTSQLGALLIVAACGDGATLPDAGLGSDGPPRGLVKVHVDGPIGESLRVWFQSASSSTVLATKTDAAGNASAWMEADGFVSIYGAPPSFNILYTWTGVQPGDELTLDLSTEGFGDAVPLADVRIDPMEGASSYYISSYCEASVEVSLAIDEPFAPFFKPCTSTSDLLVVAGTAFGIPLGYRFRANANISSGGTIDLRGPYSPFDATVEVTGPANDFVDVNSKLAGVEYEVATSAQLAGTHVAVPVQMPVLPDETAQTIVRTLDFESEDGQQRTVERTGVVWGPATRSTAVDVSMPIRKTSLPGIDLDTYSLVWSEESEGAPGDVVWAHLSLGGFQWVVIGARTDATALRLPRLPNDLRLERDSVLFGSLSLIVAEGGYERLRPYLLGHWSPSAGSWWPMKEASGRVSYRTVR